MKSSNTLEAREYQRQYAYFAKTEVVNILIPYELSIRIQSFYNILILFFNILLIKCLIGITKGIDLLAQISRFFRKQNGVYLDSFR